MEDSELPEQKYAMAFGAIPDKAEERTVIASMYPIRFAADDAQESLRK